MRNNTPIGIIFAAVFGPNDPYTGMARKAVRAERIGWNSDPTRPTLFDADKMLQQLIDADSGGLSLAVRKDGRPLVLQDVPKPAKEVLRAWADGGFDGRAAYALRWMYGEPVETICAALRSLSVFQEAGVPRNRVGDLSEEGYDLGAIGSMLAEGVPLEYALAVLTPDNPRAAPF